MPRAKNDFRTTLFLFVTKSPITDDIFCGDGVCQFLIYHPDPFRESGGGTVLQYVGIMTYNLEELLAIGNTPTLIKLWCSIKVQDNGEIKVRINHSDILRKGKKIKITKISNIFDPEKLERMQQT